MATKILKKKELSPEQQRRKLRKTLKALAKTNREKNCNAPHI
jgi:uncharacterized membrane protein